MFDYTGINSLLSDPLTFVVYSRGTMVFSVFGLGIAYFSIYQMATGQMTKKEPAD